jgi:hypothetical protein
MRLLNSLLLCAAAGASAAASIAGCSPLRDCDLDDTAKKRAGKGAVSCGTVPPDGSRTAANACVEAAFLAGRPFWVRFDKPGTTSKTADVIVRTPEGRVLFLRYDSSPCGSSACGAQIVETACTGAFVMADPLEPVACATRAEPQTVCD